MPDRYVGHRTPEGGWTWEAAASPQPKRRYQGPLIALAAAGAIAACLLGAGILLTKGNAEPSSNPAAIAEPTFSLMVWNRETDQWQAENLNLTPAPTEGLTFLLNIVGLDRTHEVGISFECGGPGSIELVAADDPEAPLTSPGPGRLRPDTTALAGTLAAWSATFSGAPQWDEGGACSELQTVSFSAVNREETSSFIWEATGTQNTLPAESSLSVAASVDGESVQTITARFVQ